MLERGNMTKDSKRLKKRIETLETEMEEFRDFIYEKLISLDYQCFIRHNRKEE